MVRRIGMRCSPLLIVLLVVTSPARPTPAQGNQPQPFSAGQPESRPYVVQYAPGRGFARATPIDPATLADAGATVEYSLPELGYFDWWCRSADGATLATYDGQAMVVRDAATAAVRHRFPLEWELLWCAISRDGSRLVAGSVLDRQLSATALRWQTYDLRTGRLISDIAGEHAGDLRYWIDPEGQSLYQLWWQYPNSPGDGPRHPTLIAYDLDAGRQRARLTLDEVIGGGWLASQGPVMYAPAGVLLPDGKRFVVVHVDLDALTIVDTETMTVERTVALRHPTSLLDRLRGLLPLVPRHAAAAAVEGVTIQAALHPDGWHLYVTGNAWQPKETGTYGSGGLGLLLINIETGLVNAETSEAIELYELVVSPDGRDVYGIGPASSASASAIAPPPLVLRRFDPATLVTLATREGAFSSLEFLPAAALDAIGAVPIEC